MSIKRNFIFSSILTVANYLFPFLVYPYVARVLGVENIGICNFVDSIVNYAMLISMMGINILGVREIAKAKSNREQLDRAFTGLMVVCSTFTLISTVALVTATYAVSSLAPYKPLLLIGVLKLWSNFLLIDWLYRGLEDFKYITIRTILVKCGYVASVFLLVTSASDYILYYLLLCLMFTVNAMFNCWRATKLVSFRLSMADVRRVLKPFVTLGIYIILNSFYLNFNILYLGFTSGDIEVGYYTTATKTFQLILALYTAYSSVIVPRASVLMSQNRHDEFRLLISKSIDGLLLFAIPVLIFTMIYSDGIIEVIGGRGYEGAVLPMTIVCPLIFIIGYEQILVLQILTPLDNDRIILFNSVVGATVGIIFNLLLVKPYAAVGASVVWVLAEISVLISAQYFVTKHTYIKFPYKRVINNLLAYIPYVIIIISINAFYNGSVIAKMFIGLGIGILYFVLVQTLWLKNQVFISVFAVKLKSLMFKQ